MPRHLPGILLALGLLGGSALAGPPQPAAKSPDTAPGAYAKALDTSRIRALYLEGEFELAIDELEHARKQGQLLTHSDSVFAFKHLGVMYAASYSTVERGKQYMVQLLTIEPTVRILDMYASEMIYMIFRNVQAEMEHARGGPGLHSDSRPPRDTSLVPTKRAHWPYWAAGSVALAAGVGAIVYYTVFDEEPRKPTHSEGGLPP